MRVREALKVFEKVVADLKATPQDLECAIVNCPDGCYTGDLQGAPYRIEVDIEPCSPCQVENDIVVLSVYYK